MRRQPNRRFCPSPLLLFCLFATSHDLEFSLTPQIFLRVHLICFVSQLYNSSTLHKFLFKRRALLSFIICDCLPRKAIARRLKSLLFGISFFQRRFCDDGDGDLLLHFYVDNIFTVLTSRGP